MKPAFAPLLLALCCLSAPSWAEMSQTDWLACDQAAATGQASDDCKTLRAAYFDGVSACMAKRAEKAGLAGGATRSNGPHANRARYILCTAEVQEGLGIAAK